MHKYLRIHGSYAALNANSRKNMYICTKTCIHGGYAAYLQK